LNQVVRIDENQPGLKKAVFLQKTKDGKQILRDAMGRHIPESVTGRTKQGFSSPDASWFKGESIDFVRQTLMSNGARIYTYLDKEPVQEFVSEHLTGKHNRRLLIWSLLNVEQLLRNESYAGTA
jgi:asparagine synthase (glutamine-hydrolysing)